ncbi:MAG: SDR family NAD(P)-dependent oxidoreductase [Calditrichae bacterium]|nr:SDR family NAD(P)-dependent oxidoreductase [Calditrichota bacterium]MCB9059761.1 SDR family NAD(P)-dependent oxidoreductase [Calditrichia bacterium]
MDILNKVAIVTGASKGIGRRTAELLAEKGAKLAISARSKDLLNEVAAQLPTETFVFAGDMSDEQDIKKFVDQTQQKFGRIDILINNAGLGIFQPIAETTTENWDTMFNLNVRGLFLCTRESLPYLRRSEDSVIVNVASLAGKNAVPGGAGYAATKHAVLGFSRTLMLEERKNGVRVLAICPGSVDTEFFDPNRVRSTPRDPGKILKANDVASSIVHMIELPANAMLSEIDIRPSNP